MDKVKEFRERRARELEVGLFSCFNVICASQDINDCSVLLTLKEPFTPGTTDVQFTSPSAVDRGRVIAGLFRKRRSDVWAYFSPKYLSEDGTPLASCKLCCKVFSACNTTNLKSHLTSVHRHDYVTDLVKDKKVNAKTGPLLQSPCMILFAWFGVF